jgi:hypothetical protein
MSFIQRLLGARARPAGAPASQPHSQLSSSQSQQHAMSQNSTRRELLRVVLRDTLHRQGIPTEWIAAEVLTTTSRTGERGVHWRLLVKHWDPRILTHGVAIQHALIKRVTAFDPVASTWLSGISWQFALEDESACPQLPHPGSWTSPLSEAAPQPAAAAPDGGVIEGPVHIADAAPPAREKDAESARADLDQLLAIRDADFREHASSAAGTWVKTEPAKL